MAQKQKLRPSPLDEPPTASSSDSEEEEPQQQQPSSQKHEEEEDEEVSSGEEEEEEEDASSEEEEEGEDLPPPPVSKNPPPPPANPQPQHSSSESETESGSETESEPDPTPVKVKPLASKPMNQAQKPKAQSSPAPPPKLTLKRPAENNNNNARAADPKRAKKKATESSSAANSAAAAASDDEMEEDGKKSGDNSKKFQRLWSEEDELAIVKGVVEFTSKTGLDPLKLSNTNAFHDFVKKSLHVEVSSNQLKEKVRRLKKKFETQASKGRNGDAPKFSKPHDQKLFELSKKVWGSEVAAGANGAPVDKSKSNGSAVKSPKKKESGSRNVASAKKPKPESKPEPVPVLSLEYKDSEKKQINQKPDGSDASLFLRELARSQEGVSICKLDEDDMKRGLELIGESKRAELSGKWKKLHLAEMELFANRSELIGEQTKLILEALRASNH